MLSTYMCANGTTKFKIDDRISLDPSIRVKVKFMTKDIYTKKSLGGYTI